MPQWLRRLFRVPCSLPGRQAGMLRGHGGFTLVELIVAIGIFSILTSIAAGSFASALRSQRQSAALLTANSNVSLMIEQMVREMRTGSDFCVNGQNCPRLDTISFRNAKGEIVTYCLLDDAVRRGIGAASSCSGSNFYRLSSDNVRIEHLAFYLQGNQTYASGDREQPRITISLSVAPLEQNITGNVLHIQTTASPRFPLDS